MDKEQLDRLYHDLRGLCVSDDLYQKDAVMGITSHLTQPQGDYTGLLRFLNYYGDKYILPPVIELLSFFRNRLKVSRVVELGAGFCWLGRGISNAYGQFPALFVDKRQWPLIDIIADIETKNGAKRVLGELKDGDLVVMSELLHCLGDPRKVMRQFSKWPMLVVEYMPTDPAYRRSYDAQIKKFNCEPIADIRDVFSMSEIRMATADPYMIWLVLPL